MDYYKKQNLKFNSEVSREIRHAETVKARKSSRFKRLSMLRCIDEDQPSFEKPKESAIPEVKKPVSRLEILRKWKHEKIVKEELKKKNSIRPFYAGAPPLKSSYQGASRIGKCNQPSGNMNGISKKVPSCNSSLVSRVPNTLKQASSCDSNQISRIPNNTKQVSSCNSIQTSRIANSSKQVSSSATLTSRIPNGPKPLSLVPKTAKNTQPQLQRIPSANQELFKKPAVFGKNTKTNQVLPRSKIQTGTSSPASSSNGLSSTKGFQSRIAKPASVVPRRIPVQGKLPVSNNQKPNAALSKKLPSVLPVGVKLPASSSSQKSAPGLIKKPGLVPKVALKKAPLGLGNLKQEKNAFSESTENRNKEILDDEEIMAEDNVESTCSSECKSELGSEKNIASLSEIFDCDVSVIKPKRDSFAPENFLFQPPTELLDFSFDFTILKKIKEFTSRTSTPSKQHVKVTESREEDKKVIQKPSENVEIETNISTPTKQPAQSSVNNKDDKEIIHTPSENVDVETNIPTPSKQHTLVHKSGADDKGTMQGPSENVDTEDNISTSKQHGQSSKSDEVDNEIMQRSSENVKIETNISTSEQHGQSSKSDEGDNEITQTSYANVEIETNVSTLKQHDQSYKSNEDDSEIIPRSSENAKIEINFSSVTEDLVRDCGNSSKNNLQESCNSTQPPCHNSAAADEEILLKDWESVVAGVDNFELPLNKAVARRKYRESNPLNTFQKRPSIFKMSTLNSIAEAEDFLALSPDRGTENKENVFVTPRRSRRISKLISIDESPSSSPRRSLRLQKRLSKNNQLDDSNYKSSSHTNLTNDFDKLTLEDFDNMDPNDYLCDFDSPEKAKSTKISLLYSPDKRKSIRRSIRGDLMSFSPANSPQK